MSETNEKKDIVEKEFVTFPDVAADVINVLLYQGERMADKDSSTPKFILAQAVFLIPPAAHSSSYCYKPSRYKQYKPEKTSPA